jgi:enoyl-CoA hydratase
MSDHVRVETDGAAAWLTFDNPGRRNALTIGMGAAIVDAVRTADADPDVRVVVLRGAGDEAFMSGADIAEQDARPDEFADGVQRTLDALGATSKPVVAMIRGFCLGGGLAMALEADLRIAADDGVFGIPAARLGIGYRFDGVARLVGLVGPAVAADILFTGRRIRAEEALAVGLVQRVHPAAELEDRVRELVATIAANAPLTIRAAKAAIRATQADPADRDLAELDRLVRACRTSEDYAEGKRAFFEKRAPRFQGH